MTRIPRLAGLLAAIAITALVAACTGYGAGAGGGATATAAGGGSTAAAGQPLLQVRQDASLGAYLADATGQSLYVFTKDSAGKSACAGSCAQTWPPLTLPAGASLPSITGLTGTLGTIDRADGSRQVTLAGMPLYRYAADTAPGQTSGQGVGGVWFLASPAGTPLGGASGGSGTGGSGGTGASPGTGGGASPTAASDCYGRCY